MLEGKPIAILGMDYPRTIVYYAILVHRLQVITIILMVASLTFLLFYLHERRQWYIESISEARDSLQEKEEYLSCTMNSIGDAVISTDAQRRVVRMNPVAEALTGLVQSDVIGLPISEILNIVNTLTHEPTAISIDEAMSTGEVCHLADHTTLISRDGTERQIADSAAPIRDGTGTITGTVIVLSDMTEQYRTWEALKEAGDRSQSYLDVAGVMLVSIAWDQTITLINKKGCEALGYSNHELIGKNWFDVCIPEHNREEAKALFVLLMHGEFETVEFYENLVVTRSGEERMIHWHNVLLRDMTGAAIGTLSSGEDITERKLLSDQLEAAATQVIDLVSQVVTVDSFTGRFENPSLSRCWEEKKCTRTECPSYKNVGNLRCWEVAGTFCGGEIQGTFANKYGNCSFCKVYRDARSNPIMELGETFNSMAAVLENRREALIQAKVEVEEHAIKLSHQATHDALTDLPNRHCFEQHLSELIISGADRESHSFIVLFLDLDKFKQINDTLGHKAGDLLLIEVAKRLQSCLRSEDILARMGGDEFTVILPRCSNRSIAQLVACRIIDSISRPFEIQGHRLLIGASIGLAGYPSDGTDTVTLLRHADAAMYKAKQSGRGTFYWYSGDMDVENQQRADMEMDIRIALDEGKFNVYYQPIVSLRHGNILAAEALLRWEHPEKGMIPPSLIISIAEDIGIIGEIGDYVLRTACAQTMAWRDEGIHLSQIAVNVSTAQFHDASWLDSVRDALSDTGIDAQCLDLEVTETGFAVDYESIKATLRRVQELGICISIDDFGIGQSSLSRFKDFPVIQLKIDGSFIKNIEHGKNERALVISIIEMAHSQGIKVTAEWVETELQIEILRSIGCDFAQGYLISPALPAEAFADFYRQWTLV